MKIPYIVTIVTSVIAMMTVQCTVAQSYKTFTKDCEPKEISADRAKSDAKTLVNTCGFESVYVTRLDIEDLLKLDKCVGVRFYISKEKSDQAYVDVTAVAISELGEELKSEFQRHYLMVKSLNEKSYQSYGGWTEYL